MLRKGFLKPKFSKQEIGNQSFWIGVFIGVAISTTLSLFLNQGREAVRFLTFSNDLIILTEKEWLPYDVFFASLSITIGFCFTVFYWIRNYKFSKRKRHYKYLIISSSFLVSFVALMIISRFGSVLGLVVYGNWGFDFHFNFYDEFKIILFLVPIYILLAHWQVIRLVFCTRHAIVISFFVITAFTLLLLPLTKADREILETALLERHMEKYSFIEEQIDFARKIGVTFDKKTVKVLPLWNAESKHELVKGVKNAFNKESSVSIDTLILARILVHNFDFHSEYIQKREHLLDTNWPYPLPEHVLRQIQLQKNDEIPINILIDILNLYVEIFTANELTSKQLFNKGVSNYEKDKFYLRRTMMYNTATIQSRLINVIDSLKKSEEFGKFTGNLTELEFNEFEGRQKRIDKNGL